MALCFGPAVIHRSCCCCQLFSQEGRKCARQKSPARKEYQRSRRSYKQRIGSACPSDCCWSDSTSIDNLLAIHRLFLSTPMFPVWLFFIIRQDAIALTLQALLPDMLCWCVFATLNRPMSRHTTTGKNMTNAVGLFFFFLIYCVVGVSTPTPFTTTHLTPSLIPSLSLDGMPVNESFPIAIPRPHASLSHPDSAISNSRIV